MKLWATTALAVSLAMTGAALAQGADPAVLYDQYLTAVAAGDYDSASRQSEAAWRAAETEWGESGDTGLLAFTAAQFRVSIGDLAGARDPAQRAVALLPVADGVYSQDEAELLLAVATAPDDPARGRAALGAALEGLDGAPPREDTVAARMVLAQLQMSEDTAAAAATAQRAIADARAISSGNLRAHLAAAGRIQYVAGQFGPANASLSESLGMWEEQQPGAFPQPLVDTLAWRTLADAAVRQTPPDPAAAPAAGGRGGPPPGFAFQWPFVPKRNCAIEWENEQSVAFPQVNQATATLGAAVVVFDLTEDGAVTNARVAGAAPTRAPEYERIMLDAMSAWSTRRSPRGACRVGFFQAVNYFF